MRELRKARRCSVARRTATSDADTVPPDAEFLFAGSSFGEHDGLPVRAQVQDLAEQPLTPILEKTIEEGGFFRHS